MADAISYNAYTEYLKENESFLIQKHIITEKDLVDIQTRPCGDIWGQVGLEKNPNKQYVSVELGKYNNHTGIIKICACGKIYEKKIPGRHLSTCVPLATEVRKRDVKVFQDYVTYNKSLGKGCGKAFKAAFPEYVTKPVNNVVPIHKKQTTKQEDKPSPPKLDFLSKLGDYSTVLQRCNSYVNFPSASGIYFIIINTNNNDEVLYVGKSVNMKERWKQHHRLDEIKFLEKLNIEVKYYYIAENPVMQFRDTLENIEKHFIELLEPKLNYEKVTRINCG